MQFSTIIAPLALAGAAIAQAAAPSAAPSGAPAPGGTVSVQVVKVGGNNGELTFSPSDIQAPVGSMVQFQFYPKNHSVAQASFAQPCMPIAQSMPNVTNPIWSGFMPTQQGAQMMATYTIMINNTTPIWLYCAQTGHCQKGMVAAINANNATGKTLDAFKSAAAQASTDIAPGSSNSTSSSGSGSTGTGSSGSGSTPGSTPPSPSASGESKVASGASSVSFGASTVALAGLLSVIVTYAL